MQQEPWTYIIVHAAPKIENLLFFLYIRNTFWLKKKTNRMIVIFWPLDMNMNGYFADFLLFYICFTIS